MLLTRGEVLGAQEVRRALPLADDRGARDRREGPARSVRQHPLRRGSAHILRRPFSVYRVHKRGGWASTIEIVFDIRGAGTEYLSHLRPHMIVDLVGPLGRGFALPKGRAHCLLVGGGIGAAPLFFLADELRNDGHRVDVILGARSNRMLLNPIEVRRLASVARVVTEDGSTGDQGRVTDVLEETIERCETEIIYACGPHPMLEAVTRIGVDHKLPVQVAVEELMACGYGVCMTCVMPLKVKKPEQRSSEVRRGRPTQAHLRKPRTTRSSTPGRAPKGRSSTERRSCGTEPRNRSRPIKPSCRRPVSPVAHGSLEDSADEHPPPGN